MRGSSPPQCADDSWPGIFYKAPDEGATPRNLKKIARSGPCQGITDRQLRQNAPLAQSGTEQRLYKAKVRGSNP